MDDGEKSMPLLQSSWTSALLTTLSILSMVALLIRGIVTPVTQMIALNAY
jgi:hypothetical protein